LTAVLHPVVLTWAMNETIRLIHEHGLIALVTAPVEDRLFDWAIAVAKGGIKLLAIPVGFPSVTELTSDLSDEAHLHVGVTGVTSVDQLSVALAAGAHFIVSPVCNPDLIGAAKERGMTVIAGAATPTEVMQCAAVGPDLIALFPVGPLGGPDYLAWVLWQFPELNLLAAGGVDVESAPGYLEAGAIATIVDRGVFPADEDPSATEVITVRALALTEVCNDVMGRQARRGMTEVLSQAGGIEGLE